MWYFAWILGLGLALTFGVLNAIWFELTIDRTAHAEPPRMGDAAHPGPSDIRSGS